MPDNPADFANFAIFRNTNGAEATLGGQPGGWGPGVVGPFGALIAKANYPGDYLCNLHNLTMVPTPAGMTDMQFITSLLREYAAYGNNLMYDIFPDKSLAGQTYNSNSFVSGLLIGAGASPPNLPGFRPGYGTPIPVGR
jgi:hypothetical protein